VVVDRSGVDGSAHEADPCGLDWIRERSVETREREEELRFANEAWRSLAKDLVQRVPFYESHYGDAGAFLQDVESLEDLPQLPFVDKADTRRSQEEAPPYGLHLGVDKKEVKKVFQTSGSSGAPSLIALTAADQKTWTTIGARSYFGAGVHPHSSVLATFGAGPYVAGHTHQTLAEIGAGVVPVAPGDTERVVSAIRQGLVDTLLATPSFALHLAQVLEDQVLGGARNSLRLVVVGGEPGGGIPAIRERLESGLGAHVREASGIGDVSPSLYGECFAQTGMHFGGQGLVWVEVIDPVSGSPIEIRSGARGELVYTTLVREAMPMVRFRSGDIAEVVDTSCVCGRTSFKIRIHGRSDDMFIVRGVNVYPSAVQAVIARFHPAVTGRSRVVLPPGASVSVEPPVLVEVEVGWDRPDQDLLHERIESAIKAKLNFRASVTFRSPAEFGEAGYKTSPTNRIANNEGDA